MPIYKVTQHIHQVLYVDAPTASAAECIALYLEDECWRVNGPQGVRTKQVEGHAGQIFSIDDLDTEDALLVRNAHCPGEFPSEEE